MRWVLIGRSVCSGLGAGARRLDRAGVFGRTFCCYGNGLCCPLLTFWCDARVRERILKRIRASTRARGFCGWFADLFGGCCGWLGAWGAGVDFWFLVLDLARFGFEIWSGEYFFFLKSFQDNLLMLSWEFPITGFL